MGIVEKRREYEKTGQWHGRAKPTCFDEDSGVLLLSLPLPDFMPYVSNGAKWPNS